MVLFVFNVAQMYCRIGISSTLKCMKYDVLQYGSLLQVRLQINRAYLWTNIRQCSAMAQNTNDKGHEVRLYISGEGDMFDSHHRHGGHIRIMSLNGGSQWPR